MSVILFILGLLALFGGVIILLLAKTALHEIEGFILFLISAVLISGSSIVEAVNSLKSHLKTTLSISNNETTPNNTAVEADTGKEMKGVAWFVLIIIIVYAVGFALYYYFK